MRQLIKISNFSLNNRLYGSNPQVRIMFIIVYKNGLEIYFKLKGLTKSYSCLRSNPKRVYLFMSLTVSEYLKINGTEIIITVISFEIWVFIEFKSNFSR